MKKSLLVPAAGAVAAVALISNATQSASGVVPWVATPGQSWATAAAGSNPACDLSTLSIPPGDQRWGGVWHGQTSGYFTLRNDASTTCELAVPTAVSANTNQGPVSFDPSRAPQDTLTLTPGDVVAVQVLAPGDCAAAEVDSTSFTFTFAQGAVPVPDAKIPVQCGGTLVDFHNTEPGQSDALPPAASDLQATLTSLPSSASAGAAVRFVVTLTNPTDSDIDLSKTCPSYTESLKGINGSGGVYQLNCAQAPVVPARGAVKFAMQLTTPAGTPPGRQFVTWHLLVPAEDGNDAQFATADVSVS